MIKIKEYPAKAEIKAVQELENKIFELAKKRNYDFLSTNDIKEIDEQIDETKRQMDLATERLTQVSKPIYIDNEQKGKKWPIFKTN